MNHHNPLYSRPFMNSAGSQAHFGAYFFISFSILQIRHLIKIPPLITAVLSYSASFAPQFLQQNHSLFNAGY
nr:MAG TPA: hypothetical protein [Caudoviricetes sp.]